MADLDTTDGLADTWRIALSIDTTNYTGSGVRIDEVAVKVSSAVDKVTLLQAPGGLGVWSQPVAGGLNANGCSGSGSGFECADWKVGSPTGAFIPGPVMTWVFDIDVSGGLFTAANLSSIKARYVSARDGKVGALVSENVTLGDPIMPVPEPARSCSSAPASPARSPAGAPAAAPPRRSTLPSLARSIPADAGEHPA